MAEFIGKGSLGKYSQLKVIHHPIKVNEVSELLTLPEEIANNLIVVRHNKKLGEDEFIYDEDQIYIFFAAMGG